MYLANQDSCSVLALGVFSIKKKKQPQDGDNRKTSLANSNP